MTTKAQSHPLHKHKSLADLELKLGTFFSTVTQSLPKEDEERATALQPTPPPPSILPVLKSLAIAGNDYTRIQQEAIHFMEGRKMVQVSVLEPRAGSRPRNTCWMFLSATYKTPHTTQH